MTTGTLSIDQAVSTLDPVLIDDIILGFGPTVIGTLSIDQVDFEFDPLQLSIDQVTFGWAGDSNTYHKCVTDAGGLDTLSLYVDGVESERDTVAAKQIGTPGSNYVNIDKSSGEQSFAGTSRIAWTKITAASVTITVGGTDASSVVANLQTANDGNVFHIDEQGASPAIDLYIEFTSVTAFNWVKVLGQYDGSTSHDLTIQLYNWNTTAWDTFNGLPSMNYDTTPNRTFHSGDFFVPSDTNYIGTGGNAGKVRVRFVHFIMGNASHDLYIDNVALYQ